MKEWGELTSPPTPPRPNDPGAEIRFPTSPLTPTKCDTTMTLDTTRASFSSYMLNIKNPQWWAHGLDVRLISTVMPVTRRIQYIPHRVYNLTPCECPQA
uniref:Uncharacterized protein n=1 Tax=Timema cristinae TaxID=61476 RepID=A0A7R9CK06_TIMCR|nr:unnamed protein product [Timema cristinae]